MAGRLEGKVVAVTGGGRGIGRAAALRMAEQGARLVIADYGGPVNSIGQGSSAPADAVAEEVRKQGGQAVPIHDNVATTRGGQRVTEAALERFGRLDGLVCCAGIDPSNRPFWEAPEQEWDEVIAVHLRGHYACARAAIPVMIKQRSGRLVFISSSASIASPTVGMGPGTPRAYNAAKAGILGLMWSTALAVREHGITCNALFPGAATRMIDQGLPPTERGASLRSELAAGSWRDPANVAPIIIYLVSDAGARITGQIFGAIGSRIVHFEPVRAREVLQREPPGWDGHLEELFQRFPREIGEELVYRPDPWPPKGPR